jgi:hypothetical protein
LSELQSPPLPVCCARLACIHHPPHPFTPLATEICRWREMPLSELLHSAVLCGDHTVLPGRTYHCTIHTHTHTHTHVSVMSRSARTHHCTHPHPRTACPISSRLESATTSPRPYSMWRLSCTFSLCMYRQPTDTQCLAPQTHSALHHRHTVPCTTDTQCIAPQTHSALHHRHTVPCTTDTQCLAPQTQYQQPTVTDWCSTECLPAPRYRPPPTD